MCMEFCIVLFGTLIITRSRLCGVDQVDLLELYTYVIIKYPIGLPYLAIMVSG